jgi:hypothetical protein
MSRRIPVGFLALVLPGLSEYDRVSPAASAVIEWSNATLQGGQASASYHT